MTTILWKIANRVIVRSVESEVDDENSAGDGDDDAVTAANDETALNGVDDGDGDHDAG